MSHHATIRCDLCGVVEDQKVSPYPPGWALMTINRFKPAGSSVARDKKDTDMCPFCVGEMDAFITNRFAGRVK